MNAADILKDKIILVVDDEPDVTDTVEDLLDMCMVRKANDFDTARQYLMSYSFDIVVLDITMPEMNGLEAMKRIFAFDPDARIIICSAIGQQNLIVDAINSGIKDFIVKPFKPERLLSAINKALKE